MKKLFLAILAMAAFGTAEAQTARFGIKGGLNISTLTGEIENAEPKIGAHLGGLVEIKVAKKFAIQPELLFSLQGAKNDYVRNIGNTRYVNEEKINLLYLQVPVMAKFYVLPSLSLEAGPQLGVLLDAESKYSLRESNGNNASSSSRSYDIKNNLRTLDAGFNLGASYYFNNNIFVQARYSFGLSSIDKRDYNDNNNDDFDDYDYDNGIHNGVFQASFGYRF